MTSLPEPGPGAPARVATAQLDLAPGALEANRRRCAEAIGEAARGRADLVVLPELASSGYGLGDREHALAASEPVPGPATESWQAGARRHGCWVVGGVCERDGSRLFNTAVVVGPDGVVAKYRKLHLFAGEKAIFEPGDLGLPTVDLPFGRIGILVCYDLRFVESARVLALRGAALIAVPTAWVGGFDRERPADGIIDQVRGAAVQANLDMTFIACASRVGADGDLAYLGSSCVVDPYGRLVHGPAPGDAEEVAVVEVDLAQAAAAGRRGAGISPREDRRTDVYGELLGYDADGYA
jgi:N-carbamoylputrescine amidase